MMIGSTIGQYRIENKLGAGGMGEVYRALDTMLEREVALKVLHRFATQDAGWLERFRSEAVTLARLNHPNIAILHNFLEVGQDYYMVMEFVQGATFEELLKREGKLPLRTALDWFCQALRGFEHAHARNVIHRDIKPANLMLNDEGLVKITDFGIARVMGGQHLTKTGKVIGTLEYMSPEQVRGEEQDARSDIYALGILLHELTTAKVPFSGTSDYEIMRSHLELAPRPPRELSEDLPPAIEAAILKALSKKASDRFQSVAEFRASIEPTLTSLPAEKVVVALPSQNLSQEPTIGEFTSFAKGAPRASEPETSVADHPDAVNGVINPTNSLIVPTSEVPQATTTQAPLSQGSLSQVTDCQSTNAVAAAVAFAPNCAGCGADVFGCDAFYRPLIARWNWRWSHQCCDRQHRYPRTGDRSLVGRTNSRAGFRIHFGPHIERDEKRR